MTADARLAALETLRTRLCAAAAVNDGAAVTEAFPDVAPLMDSLRADGSWADIRYQCAELKDWNPAIHLSRLLAMAQAWVQEASPRQGEPAVLNAILRGLDGWYTINPQSANWWWNQIGAPMTLGEILIRIKGACDRSHIEKAIPAFTSHLPAVRFTGQNLVWVAAVQVRHGVLLDDPALVSQGYMLIARELCVFPDEEGIQPDMSFHQHGKVLYSGGYGQGFAADVARFAWIAHGTPYAWPDHKIRLLTRYLLDGSRWMVRGRTFDYGACGREITRQGHSAERLFQGVAYLSQTEQPRQAEVAAMHANRTKPGVSHVTGNRHFWCSDLMTQHRPAYYVSVRMTSSRIENADWPCCGGEGRLCHHIAEGVTFLMRDGDEYRDLFPVWNWRQLPGTTAEQPAGALDPGALRGHGERSFCGGASDGSVGCAAMDFRRQTLTARKAYFLFDDALVALGAGIVSESDAPVATTINQCHWRGKVLEGAGDPVTSLVAGNHRLAPGRAFWHDGFTYRILDGTGSLTLGPQSGSWSGCGVGSNAVETLPVLNARLDHGVRPNGSAYAYAVVSAPDAPSRPDVTDASRFIMVANTPALQAVWDARDGRGHAVFYLEGNVRFPDGQSVTVDRGCILLYRVGEAGDAILTLAEAERNAGLLAVSLSGKRTARATISLPQGDAAGSSCTLILP